MIYFTKRSLAREFAAAKPARSVKDCGKEAAADNRRWAVKVL